MSADRDHPLQTQSNHPHPYRSALALFLFLSAWYAITSSGRLRVPDEYVAYYQTESLVTRQSITIPQAFVFGNFYGMLDRFRQPRAPYPAGQALAAAPFFMAGKWIAATLKPKPASIAEEFYLIAAVTTMTSAILTAAAIAVLFLLLLKMGFSHRTALPTSLYAALTTLLWPYAGYFFSEPLACLLLALSALVLFPARDAEKDSIASQVSLKAASLGAILLAALLWVRVTHALAIAVFCGALLATQKPSRIFKPLLILTAIVGISLGLYLLRNHYLFGSYFQFGYPEYTNGNRRLNSFITPFQVGLLGFLFSPGKSVFLYMPMAVLGLLGLRRFWAHSRGLTLVAVFLPVTYLLFYMKYAQWEGGRCLGPRYLLPAFLFLFLPAAPFLELRNLRSKLLVYILGAVGLIVQLVSMATSFLEAQEGHGYYDSAYNYRLAYFQLGEQLRLLRLYANGSLPQKLGLGWDRWFVFLHHAGAPSRFIAIVLTLEALCVVGFGWWLIRDYRCVQNGSS